MNPPTEEKTMEWELEMKLSSILSAIETNRDRHNSDLITGKEYLEEYERQKNKLKALLASSQDSFRRKVEEEQEKLGKQLNSYERMSDEIDDDNRMLIELIMKIRKFLVKLKNIK